MRELARHVERSRQRVVNHALVRADSDNHEGSAVNANHQGSADRYNPADTAPAALASRSTSGHAHPEEPTAPQPEGIDPGGFLAVALGFGAIAQGGFYGRPALILGALVAAAVVMGALRRRPNRVDLDSAIYGCALLALATVLSALTHGSLDGVSAPLALLAGAAGAVFAVRRCSAGWRETLRSSVVVVGVIIAATSWIGSAFHLSPWALVAGGLWRGASTLTYANAAGAAIAIALPLAVGDRRQRWKSVVVFVLLTGLGSTLSRGAVVAALIGSTFYAWQSSRKLLIDIARPAIGAAIATAALVIGMPIWSSPRPTLALCGLALGLAVSLMPQGRFVLVVVAIAIIGASPVAIGSLREAVRNRVGTGSDDRTAEWVESWRLFTESPIFGVGPGRYELRYTERGEAKVARYAHNEYLQIATEVGALGLGVSLMSLLAVWTSVRRVDAEYGAALLASAAAAALDFTWHFPLIVLMSAVIVGLSVTPLLSTDSQHSMLDR